MRVVRVFRASPATPLRGVLAALEVCASSPMTRAKLAALERVGAPLLLDTVAAEPTRLAPARRHAAAKHFAAARKRAEGSLNDLNVSHVGQSPARQVRRRCLRLMLRAALRCAALAGASQCHRFCALLCGDTAVAPPLACRTHTILHRRAAHPTIVGCQRQHQRQRQRRLALGASHFFRFRLLAVVRRCYAVSCVALRATAAPWLLYTSRNLQCANGSRV